MDLDYLKIKRPDLEERVKVLNPGQTQIELGVYDKIVDAKEIRSEKIKEDAQKARQDYHSILEEYDREIAANALTIENLHALIDDYSEENALKLLRLARESLVEDGGEDRYVHKRETNIHRNAEKYGHKPAYIFVLNFSKADHIAQIRNGTGYWSNGPIVQNGHGKQRTCIGASAFSKNPEVEKQLYNIAFEDGAIILDSRGHILATNAELESYHEEPDSEDTTLNQKLGIIAGGNTRQHAAAFGSKIMPGTVIYTLGEETPHIRRYSNGALSFSTHEAEDDLARARLGLD